MLLNRKDNFIAAVVLGAFLLSDLFTQWSFYGYSGR